MKATTPSLRSLLAAGFSLLALSSSAFAALVAGWDFQTTTTGGTAVLASPSTPKQFAANFGSGTLYLNGSEGSSSWFVPATGSTGTELNGFGGSAVNATNGLSTTTSGIAALALVGGAGTSPNFAANGKMAVFKVNMTGYQDLVISLSAQATASGFTQELWEYSTDGTNYSTIGNLVTGTTAGTLTTTFVNSGVLTLPTVTGLNNAASAYVRVTFTGASSNTGNNRLDNIQFNASTYVPPGGDTITLTANNTSFGENAGSNATTVNVTLSQAAPPGGLTLILSDSDLDDSEISLPANVIIAEGQTTGSFVVGALADTLVDGSQVITITATVSGYSNGTTQVTVTDTTPSISLSGVPASFLETAGASASTITVTLSQPAPVGGLLLNLSSNDSDNSEITLPATVTVAEAATTATFTIGALTDSLADSDQLITITATPAAPNTPGFAVGSGSFTVQNVDAPPVQFSQYFENTGTSKVLEIKNTTGASLPLTSYYLAIYTNAAADSWKTSALPIASGVSLSTRSIPANGSILVGNTANGGAGLPAYVLNYNYNNGANLTNNTIANYNGNDSVVLYNDANANGSLEVSEIVDALAFTNVGNEGQEKSFHRISPSQGFSLTTGSKITDFASVWTVKDLLVPATLAEVIAATPTDAFYLQGAVLPITLTPTVSSFAENATTPASVVTVAVPYNVTANTTVTLAVTVGGSPDATEITVPASVVILSGTNSITFDVAALTDTTADGNQIATITATATGYTSGNTALTVTDIDNAATLTLGAVPASFAENAASPASVLTVTIPAPAPFGGVTVTLSNPDATELTVPASVVILEGQTFASVNITAVNDNLLDGPQNVTLTATATGYTNGTFQVTVTDVGVAYTTWQNSNFTASELLDNAVSGDNADPDGDGFSNTLEYAFGTNPRTGNSATAFPQSTVTAGALGMSYRRPVGGALGVTYTVQVSTIDLVSNGTNWTAAVLDTDYTTSAPTPNGDGTETVTINFTGVVSGKKFGRIFVSIP